jgi:hypothetical protein
VSDEHWGGRSSPEIMLTNRVLAVCYATTSVTSAWSLPLFDRAFDGEPELRNKLFCLLVYGLLDSGWEYRNRINGLKIEAKKIGSLSAPFYLNIFEKYIALAVDMLEIFSRDEMILLTELRNQWLHGHWTELHKENRTVYYAYKGTIIKKKISSAEYNKAFYAMCRPNVEEALLRLRRNFSEYRTFFWAVDRALSAQPVRHAMQRDLMLHSQFRHPQVVLVIPEPSFKPDPIHNDAFRSIVELGPQLTKKDRR